jgi:uncharacterized membrane protein YphA (DoxX/SURF4 family)
MIDAASLDRVRLASRLLLVMTLAASGLLKIYSVNTTAKALEALNLASKPLRELAGRLLPVAELALALWLAAGWQAIWSAVAAVALMTVFNFALWSLQRIGYQGGCGCFGDKGTGPVRRVHLVRNVFLLAAAVELLPPAWQGREATEALWMVPAADLAVAGLMVAVFALLYALAAAAERLLFRAYWR